MDNKIQNACEASKNIYDDVLTQGNFLSRLYIRLFWSGTDDNAIARKVLAYIPDDFSGALLDVPVGTAFSRSKNGRGYTMRASPAWITVGICSKRPSSGWAAARISGACRATWGSCPCRMRRLILLSA